jgi:hypothetical protein
MNRIKEDQEKRISGLKKEQILSEFKALLLQKYIYEVQAIINIIQIMTNSGLSWGEINRQIKDERKSGNVLANMIFKLNLEKNNVSLIFLCLNSIKKSHFCKQIFKYKIYYDHFIKTFKYLIFIEDN